MLTLRISRLFIAGFLTGTALLVAVNLHSYFQTGNPGIADFYYEFGRPFPLYQAGGILHLDGIYWCGLIADAAVAIFAGVVLGIVCQVLFARAGAHSSPGRR